MSNQIFHSTLRNRAYREALRLRVVAALGPSSFRAHAEAYGVNHETLRRWLRGETDLPAWFVAEVALRTGVAVQELLYGSDFTPSLAVADFAVASQVDTDTLRRLKRFVAEMEEVLGKQNGRRAVPQ